MGGRRYLKPVLNKGSFVALPENEVIKSDIDYPIFCFKHLHRDYGVDMCTKDEKAALISKMATLSQLTWSQIQLAGKHGLGAEKIKRNAIKASIPSFITEDVDDLFAIRFKGKAPIVGHKSGSIFHVIYIDRTFTLYSH